MKGVKMARKIQPWYCECCSVAGKVLIDEHAGEIEVIGQLKADHNRKSPGCMQQDCVQSVDLTALLALEIPVWAAIEIADLLLKVPGT